MKTGWALLGAVIGCVVSMSAQELRLSTSPSPFFELQFNAVPGLLYDIEASTNLSTWDVLTTIRAQRAAEHLVDSNSQATAHRFFRVTDLSPQIVVEGWVDTIDAAYVLVSCSLDSSITYTDPSGHYVLRTSAAATPANLPFTLHFSKVGYRPHSVIVTNPTLARIDVLEIAGPSNNDFVNRFVITGTSDGRDDNTDASVEPDESGNEPSVWYTFTPPKSGTLKFAVDTAAFEPVVTIFKGNALASLLAVDRGTVSNYVEARIETTHELSVVAGERLQIRVGALPHPTFGTSSGYFDWRLTFTPNFPLNIGAYDPRQGTVTLNPLPNSSGRYAPGSSVAVTARATANSFFAGWSGSVTSSQPSLSLQMTEAKFLQPSFQIANGNFSNATPISGITAQLQAFVVEETPVWWSWRAPKDMPVTLRLETTNFLHVTAYHLEGGTNLIALANNNPGDHTLVQFRAQRDETYRFAGHFESNESGVFRFRLYESIVAVGQVTPRERFNVAISLITNTYNLIGTGFEIWTGIEATANRFPFTVTVTSPYYKVITKAIRSNDFPETYGLVLAGPPNNDFANATILTGTTGGGSGSLFEADSEPGEPRWGSSVWYSYRPAQDGTLLFTNDWTAPDVSVWKGIGLASLQLQPGVPLDAPGRSATEWTVNKWRRNFIRLQGSSYRGAGFGFSYRFLPNYPLYVEIPQTNAGTVSFSPSPASRRYLPGQQVILTATPRTGYTFAGWTGDISSSSSSATITMNSLKVVQATFRLRNDNLANATALSGLPVSATGRNLYGTSEPGEPAHCGVPAATSAWWKWTAPRTADVTLDFDYVGLDALIAVYTGNSLSNLTPVANNKIGFNERLVSFRAVAGRTYRIAVDAYAGKGGNFSFTMRPFIEGRYLLELPAVDGGYVVAGPEPDGAGQYESGALVTLRAVPLNSYSLVEWQEITAGEPIPLGSSQTIVVRMDSNRRIAPYFETPARPRMNDHFADRLTILSERGAVTTFNTAATSEPLEPRHYPGATNSRSLWWSWTAPRSAPVAMSTAGTGFDNVLAVYIGTNLATLVPVISDRGSGGANDSRVSFLSTAGETYHLAVDSITGATGAVVLRVVENEQFTAEFISPLPFYTAPARIPVLLSALNSDLTVTQVNLFTNGSLAARITQPPYLLIMSNVPPGVYQFSAEAADVYGRTVSVQTAQAVVNQFGFATNLYPVAECDAVAFITLWRSGPAPLPARVWLETISGSAVEGSDFTPLATSFTFRPWDAYVTIGVPIHWDALAEPDEEFQLVLRSSDGEVVASTTVRILNTQAPHSNVWVDDDFPGSANSYGAFDWLTGNPPPVSGSRSHSGLGEYGFNVSNSSNGLAFTSTSALYQDVYLDPFEPPFMISVTWRFNGIYSGSATWSDLPHAPWQGWMGPLPKAGQWFRLSVPGSRIGNVSLQGITWNVQGGRAAWDRTEHLW